MTPKYAMAIVRHCIHEVEQGASVEFAVLVILPPIRVNHTLCRSENQGGNLVRIGKYVILSDCFAGSANNTLGVRFGKKASRD